MSIISNVGNISIGEECAYPVVSVPTIVVKQPQFNDSSLLDEHGSPKKKSKAMLSGNKPVDQLLHTIIDNILRGEFFLSSYKIVNENTLT